MKSTLKEMARLAPAALVLIAVFSVVALAAEGDLAPIIGLLPEVPILFGVSGGVIVTVLISILKHFKIVGKDGPIPSRVANFLLSVLVAALAMILEGQPVGPALLSALSSMIVAAGLHSEIGHPLYSIAAKVPGES